MRVLRPESPITHIIEANNEYITRHLVDGRIINCDQRISFIAGYMIEEVSGLSAFKFMHREDVRWVMIALRQSKLFIAACMWWYLTCQTKNKVELRKQNLVI